MDPNIAIQLAFAVLDEAINLIRGVKAQAGLTGDQISAAAEAQDLQNKDDIKKLLAL